jgi:membrane protein involved in colicin uptake
MRKYRQEESEYLRDLQTFPARLADWQNRNAKRQQRLNAEHAQSSAEIPPLQAAADAQRKFFEPFEQAKSRSELESKKAEQDVRFIEASIQAKTSNNKRSIHRPSLFPVLDYASESERLISAMRAATKTSD